MLVIIAMIALGIACPSGSQAQYYGVVPWWGFRTLPPFPLWGGQSFFPSPFQIPFGVSCAVLPQLFAIQAEPGLRMARTPVTVSIPPVSTTPVPLTSILNLIDPSLLASGIAVLTTNYPLLYNTLVTTFNLPI